MVFPVRMQNSAAQARATKAWGQDKWPVATTFWFVVSFGSFAWVAIIFACIEYF